VISELDSELSEFIGKVTVGSCLSGATGKSLCFNQEGLIFYVNYLYFDFHVYAFVRFNDTSVIQ
jgi:prepilin-type processing-associated H-X9-DG protein